MSRATKRGASLRQEVGLRGQVDVHALTDELGLVVKRLPFRVFEEMRVAKFIAIADRLEPEWRRWDIAHAVGHGILQTGNHLWIRRNTDLGHGFEREAEDFAFGFLVDLREAEEERCVYSWQVAEHFGVPDERVRAYTSSAFQR